VAARERHGGPSSFTSQMVGQFVRTDRKQVAFERPLAVEVRQAVEKAEKGFLDDVFAGRATAEAAFDKSEEPPFVPGDQVGPSCCFALTYAIDEKRVGIRQGEIPQLVLAARTQVLKKFVKIVLQPVNPTRKHR